MKCHCGSEDWIACAPGDDAETSEGNLFQIRPEPEISVRVWCIDHWPFLQQQKAMK